MKLSTRGRYGTRALLELTIQLGRGPVSLKDIAERQEISLQYLEHLITPLIAGGIIKSTRGAKGGISLSRPPDEITLSEIIRLLEGSTAPVDCIEKPALCERSGFCVTRDTWAELQTAIDKILQATTLQDLAERQKKKQNSEELMYYI